MVSFLQGEAQHGGGLAAALAEVRLWVIVGSVPNKRLARFRYQSSIAEPNYWTLGEGKRSPMNPSLVHDEARIEFCDDLIVRCIGIGDIEWYAG